MTCEQIQNDIALWAGNDLAPQEAEEVRQHLTRCPACRVQAQKLKATLATISRSTPEPTYDSADSLWPAISRRLPHRPRKKPDLAWRKWLPSIAATVVAAGVMVAVVMVAPPANRDAISDPTPRGMGLGGANALETLRDQSKPNTERKRHSNPITRPAYETAE